MTIELSKEHEIRRLYDVEKWKRGTIVAELGVHADVVDRVLDRGADHALVAAPRPSLVDPPLRHAPHPRLRGLDAHENRPTSAHQNRSIPAVGSRDVSAVAT